MNLFAFRILGASILLSCAVSFFAEASAPAATLNLNPGESAVINPNVPTTVVCGAGTPVSDCKSEIAGLEHRYEVCKLSSSPSTCFTNEWTTFKTRHSGCLTEAFDTCIKICNESTSPSTCYNTCR